MPDSLNLATLVAGEHIYLNNPPNTNTKNKINTNITEEGGGRCCADGGRGTRADGNVLEVDDWKWLVLR